VKKSGNNLNSIMKHISVATGTYNEEENIDEFYSRVNAVFQKLPGYTYEILFIDNCSTDGTVQALRRLAATDPKV